MIKLQRIKTTDTVLYTYMEQLMVSAFPPDEYRSLEELRHYTDHQSNFYNNIIFCNEAPAGLLTYWDFKQFYYIEHFAIDPSLRNCGYGKDALVHLFTLLSSPIVLEVEEPTEEMAQRRINFYRRQGFSLWEQTYQQPPYKPGDGFLPMRLMVHGNLKCEEDFNTVKDIIYHEVYNYETTD